MTRVVIDTNVFVSSFFGGNPGKIIDLWKTGDITLCLSSPIVDEYIEVLKRLDLDDGLALQELLQLFAQGFHSLFTAKTPTLDVVRDDPEDNMFIECAVALNCRIVISGDKHLLSVKNYMGIKIASPKMFLDSL